MKDSMFYTLANEAMHRECRRLCDFTDALDQTPIKKKENIAEYKCAKYRYAAISNIHAMLLHSNRLKSRLTNSHYLVAQVDELFCKHPDLIKGFDAVLEEEKSDFGLYYGMIVLIEERIEELTSKTECATDWERVELTERLGGFRFAKECLEEAWKKRKDGEI